MRNRFLSYAILAMSLLSFPVFSQTESQAESDSTLLDLPGDNLDLFAVLDLFQKSPSIEEFEKSLNLEETGVNNLDLDLDGKVDFIKVVTEQDGDDFTFILQVDVSETEIQDVGVILVSKDADEKITMQMVGDEDLYGKDYVIEPAPPAPKVTANPAYTGPDPVEGTPATTTVVVVESAPIVQYVYSPVYVPYYPPYHYAVYPPYFAAFTVMAVGIYHHNHYYHHHGYRGGYHGNTVVVHNHNTYNNYNRSRNSSNTVNHHKSNGDYNRNRSSSAARPSTNPSTGQSRPSSGTANRAASPSTNQSRPSSGSANRAASPSTNQSRPSSGSSNRAASPSYSSRPSPSSSGRSMGSSPSRSMGSSSMSRGGGGGGRRR